MASAHEGHDHGAPLAVSIAFDGQGGLWRAAVKDGFVWVDHSDDLAQHFSAPVRVNPEPQKIGNEGEARPKIALGPQGQVYVTWTQALPTPYTGYIWFARSTDGGKQFSVPMRVHRDADEITHRFDALAVTNQGRIYVAWVDKRDLIKSQAAAQPYDGAAIYYAYSDDAGASFMSEQKLSDTSCECCRIAFANESGNTVVAMWRQLFPGGIRDHAIARIDPTQPAAVHRASFGNWKIDACPHHGPALARGGDWGWHMAWFDGGDKPGLYYARMDGEAWVSSPAKRFGNVEHQAGHPALLSLGEQVFLAWREIDEQGASIWLARSDDDGRSWGEPRQLLQTAAAADYPLLLTNGQRPYLAWNTAEKFNLIPLGETP